MAEKSRAALQTSITTDIADNNSQDIDARDVRVNMVDITDSFIHKSDALPHDSVGLNQFSATGTPSHTTFLRGDNRWATIPSAFNLHSDVLTSLGGPADADRFLLSDESASGDPNKYIEFSNLKSSILSADSVGISQLSATGTPSATTYLRGDNTWAAAGGGGSFLVHSSVSTELGTIADLDRFVVSDESENGDPNRYIEFADLKSAILSADSVGISQLSATGTPSATAYLRGDNSWASLSVGIGQLSATGTASATTYLRGDNTWASITSTFDLWNDVTTQATTIGNSTNSNIKLLIGESSGMKYITSRDFQRDVQGYAAMRPYIPSTLSNLWVGNKKGATFAAGDFEIVSSTSFIMSKAKADGTFIPGGQVPVAGDPLFIRTASTDQELSPTNETISEGMVVRVGSITSTNTNSVPTYTVTYTRIGGLDLTTQASLSSKIALRVFEAQAASLRANTYKFSFNSAVTGATGYVKYIGDRPTISSKVFSNELLMDETASDTNVGTSYEQVSTETYNINDLLAITAWDNDAAGSSMTIKFGDIPTGGMSMSVSSDGRRFTIRRNSDNTLSWQRHGVINASNNIKVYKIGTV